MTSLVLLALLGCGAEGATAVEGEVTAVGEDTIALDPGGPFALAPVLARQVHVGDRVRVELAASRPGGEAGMVTRVQFLARAAPAPDPAAAPEELPLGAPLPTLTIPGIDGPFVLGVGQGIPTVLAFLFTTCAVPTACPLLTEELRSLQAEIAGDGRIVTLTLDPEKDRLEVLRAFATRHRVDPDTWKLGRLELAALEPLLRSLGIFRAPVDGQIQHNLRLVLLDAEGRLAWRTERGAWDAAEVGTRLHDLARAARSNPVGG